jgi:hypothetical protein
MGLDAATETVTDNAAWGTSTPVLSVLIPFKGDDPTRLLHALDSSRSAEVVVLDDGTGNSELAAKVAEAVRSLSLPARFVCNSENEGRSKGRNRLARHAHAAHFLFLDGDMLPDREDFIARWVALIRHVNPAVAFGGLSLEQVPHRAEHAVHRAMAKKSDCLDAEHRRRAPEKHVFTSNLLVRRDVFETEAFDEKFAGWGWEDVEWAMRVGRRYSITHVDNPATHLGLSTVEKMAAKFEQSTANFARMLHAHRALVTSYPSYRAAVVLKHVPLLTRWRPLMKSVARKSRVPVPLRALAMRLYRAALYAESV